MSESEEVAVDSFGRVIVPKDNADSRRDHSEDADRRKRDRDGDPRDKEDGRGRGDYDHDKKDDYNDRDRFAGGPRSTDRGMADRGQGRGPDRGLDRGLDRGDRGHERGPERGPDRGHAPHQRGLPPPFNSRGGGGGGSGGRGGFNERDRGGLHGPPGGFRREERDMLPPQGMHNRGYQSGRPPSPPPLPARMTKHFDGPHVPQPLPSVLMRIDPLKSFKHFMFSQAEELTADQFQRRYEDYHLRYVEEFSETFFHGNKSQEWFRERYDPIKIRDQEVDNAVWAVKESAALKKVLHENPSTTIHAMCLDPVKFNGKAMKKPSPPTTRPPFSEASLLDSALSSGRDGKEEERKIVSAVQVADSVPSGAHLYGHEDRSAWVVMPTASSARQAAVLLKDLRVDILGPPNDIGKMEILHQFRVQAHMHTPKQYQSVPDQFSALVRVNRDTMRSIELAALLDEDRKIPEENRLAKILDPDSSPTVAAALVKYTDKLDIAIAYLRRVHFVTFYGGRRYRDEAHMLAMSPSLTHRSSPCTPSDGEIAALNAGVNATGISGPRSASLGTTLTPFPAKEIGEEKEEVKELVVDEVVLEGEKEAKEELLRLEGDNDTLKTVTEVVAGEKEGEGDAAGEGESGKKRKREDDETIPQTEGILIEKIDEVDKENEKKNENNKIKSAEKTLDPILESRELDNKDVHESSDEKVGKKSEIKPGDDKIESKEIEKTKIVPANVPVVSAVRTFPARQTGLTDRRVDNMITDISQKLKQRALRVLDPSIRGTADEEDSKTLAARQEQAFQRCMEANCSMEIEGKGRCWFLPCTKLFKTFDYLRKHLLAKHETFSSGLLLQESEPFMRARYENEDIASRPLPPVECEVAGGTERKSVREVLEKGKRPAPLMIAPTLSDQYNQGQGFSFRDRDRDSRGAAPNRRRSDGWTADRGGDRGPVRDDRERRNSIGGSDKNVPRPRDSAPSALGTTGPGSAVLPSKPSVSNYMDVDAPKEVALTIDYGVAFLPPAKRRKSIKK